MPGSRGPRSPPLRARRPGVGPEPANIGPSRPGIGRIGRTEVELARHGPTRANFDHICPGFGQIWPVLGPSWSIFSPGRAETVPLGPNLAELRPMLADCGRDLVDSAPVLGETSADVGPMVEIRPSFIDSGPHIGGVRGNLLVCSINFDPESAKFGRFLAGLARFGPTNALYRAKVGRSRAKSRSNPGTKFGRSWPDAGQIWLTRANSGRPLAEFDTMRAAFGRARAEFGRNLPTAPQTRLNLAEFGRSCPEIGQMWPGINCARPEIDRSSKAPNFCRKSQPSHKKKSTQTRHNRC